MAIDIDGVVYATGVKLLQIEKNNTWKYSTSLAEIVRWVAWILSFFKSVSRSVTPDLTDAQIEEAVRQVRITFKHYSPMSRKSRLE